MIQQKEPLSSKDFSKGLITRSDIIRNDPNQSPNCMDIKWNYDGSIQKRMGASTINSVTIGSTSVGGWTIDSSNSLNSSIQSFWKLDESAGGRADQIGTNVLFDGNTTGSIVGIRNQAALLVASASNSLTRPTNSTLETGNINFSLSTWVYLNSTSTSIQRSVISKRDPEVDAYTVLLLHCDGADGSTSFPDSSASAHAMTANGNAQVDTAQKEFGTGAYLGDGSGDWLSTPNSADYDLGTTGGADFTVDFWVRFNTVATSAFIGPANTGSNNGWFIQYNNSVQQLQVFSGSGTARGCGWVPSSATWYHVAVVRKSTVITMYINGSSIGTVADGDFSSDGEALDVGAVNHNGTSCLDGWLDEIRISKGVARWSTNFTAPTHAYQVFDFEYWLYVNTNNQATFEVSNNGSTQSAQVSASSFGALNTATWYNIIAWHSNNSHIGVGVNLSLNTTNYTTGVRVGSAPFTLGAISDGLTGQATQYLDARQDETGFWKKILNANDRSNLYGGGSGNTFSAGASGFGWAMFDFGASSIRWLTVACGTGIMASSNMGTTFVTIATSRTQTYQYLDRSKNVLIATSDAYDVPLYWAGSTGTFANTLAPNSAPSAKYNINYQGFLILLNYQDSNGTLSKRGFAYADENLQLTDAWTNHFDIPSSADDEITAAFILYKFLYVSTKYKLYRVAFVGGNPDWSYLKVKDWGFVPRTVQLMTLKGSQVAVGMDWYRRIRVFDGFDDLFLSDNVEIDNNYCDFAMSKVSLAGSGLVVSHAVADLVEQEYRMNLAIGAESTQTTHAIVVNGRSLAVYPYQNQLYQAMCMAESGGHTHLMAVDRSGFVMILNSGNLDVNQPINDNFDSSLLFRDTPEQVNQAQNLNLFFSVGSYGTIYHRDRADFSNVWSAMTPFRDKSGNTEITGNEQSLQVLRSLDIPSTYNTYQFQITSSAGTANPWRLTRFDLLQQTRGYGRGN